MSTFVKKTERVNLVMPKEMYNFLLKMVEDGKALTISDAIRKCIIYYMTKNENVRSQ